MSLYLEPEIVPGDVVRAKKGGHRFTVVAVQVLTCCEEAQSWLLYEANGECWADSEVEVIRPSEPGPSRRA